MGETTCDIIRFPKQKLLKGYLGRLLMLLAAAAHPRGKEFLLMGIPVSHFIWWNR